MQLKLREVRSPEIEFQRIKVGVAFGLTPVDLILFILKSLQIRDRCFDLIDDDAIRITVYAVYSAADFEDKSFGFYNFTFSPNSELDIILVKLSVRIEF